jgi:hypothetical protein
MDCFAEFIIGRRFAPTRWLAMTIWGCLKFESPLSSPGLTGRPSIPEAVVIESRGRGVLDRPVKPGDDDFVAGAAALFPDCASLHPGYALTTVIASAAKQSIRQQRKYGLLRRKCSSQ